MCLGIFSWSGVKFGGAELSQTPSRAPLLFFFFLTSSSLLFLSTSYLFLHYASFLPMARVPTGLPASPSASACWRPSRPPAACITATPPVRQPPSRSVAVGDRAAHQPPASLPPLRLPDSCVLHPRHRHRPQVVLPQPGRRCPRRPAVIPHSSSKIAGPRSTR